MIPGPHNYPRDREAVRGAKVQRGALRRAWGFAHPYRGTITLFLGAIVVDSLIGLIPAFAFRAILDTAIPNADRKMIAVLAGLVVLVALADGALTILQRWCSARVGEGLIYDLRVTLFDKVQRMPVAFFTRTQTGALISRLNNDVVGAETAVTSTLGSVVSNVVVLVTTLIAMLALDWQLTVLALVVLPVFVIPAKRVGRKLQQISRQNMATNAEMNSQMTERFNVSGAQLVKLFGRGDDETRTFAHRAAQVRDTGIRSAMYGRVFFVALGLVGALGAAAIYGVGAQLVVSGSITSGTLVALAALVTRVYAPLTGLTNARVDLMTAMVSFERVFEVLDAPEAITDHPDASELVAPRGRVDLDGVWFRYPPAAAVTVASLEAPSAVVGSDSERDVLRGVSLTIEPGETVALVGTSGSGKTTLASLIPRLYDVTNGAVLVDGHDVRLLTQTSLRAVIGVVSQDPHLFHDTIGANLRYARPDATDAELDAACRGARITELIAELPDGYDTMVGERGYRLSGGEKQRLAIARLLLKDPAIMILDEATSHLDNENEAYVQAALETALRGRTALVIAHRLSTVRDADRIVVLHDGLIVEQGTHDELVALDGFYAAELRAGEQAWGTGDVSAPLLGDYLFRILNAKVYDVARETALDVAPLLSERVGSRVLLKREDEQSVFSFKLRGAYNKMANLPPATLARGVIAVSAGNHAQGVAVAAARLGCSALIVMPVTTPSVKVDAVRAFGGEHVEVVLHGDSYSDAKELADSLARERLLTWVHPFDDADVIAGQGTIGMEILRQCPGRLDAIFVPIGGGGLISGIGAYIKSVRPAVRLIGVQAADSDAMSRSLAAGRRVALRDVGLFADGTAVRQVGKETFRLCRLVVDDTVVVDADEISAAIKDVFTDTRSILEPAGALAVAGLKSWVAARGAAVAGSTFVAVASGANMNFDRLRFVAERAEVGEAREAVLAVTVPEERGSFRRFCALLDGSSITEFNYRIADGAAADIFVGVQISGRDDVARIVGALRGGGFDVLDLTDDDLAKQHLRHMVGGRSARAADERLHRFEFPERPGALVRFLASMSPNWNISLFHYRAEGADYGRILVGIQVPPGDEREFRTFLKSLGYPHSDETDNPAYRLFLT